MPRPEHINDWHRADALDMLAEAWSKQKLTLDDLLWRSAKVEEAQFSVHLDRLFSDLPRSLSWRRPRRLLTGRRSGTY